MLSEIPNIVEQTAEQIGLTPDMLTMIALGVLGLLAVSVLAGVWRTLRFAWLASGIVRKPALALLRWVILPRAVRAATPRERKVKVKLPAWAGLKLDVEPIGDLSVKVRAHAPGWNRAVEVHRSDLIATVRTMREEYVQAQKLTAEHLTASHLLAAQSGEWLSVASVPSISSDDARRLCADRESEPAAKKRPADARMARLVGKGKHPWKIVSCHATGVELSTPMGTVVVERRADERTHKGTWHNLSDGGRPVGADANEWLELEWSKAAI